jgi:hypothetical protein
MNPVLIRPVVESQNHFEWAGHGVPPFVKGGEGGFLQGWHGATPVKSPSFPLYKRGKTTITTPSAISILNANSAFEKGGQGGLPNITRPTAHQFPPYSKGGLQVPGKAGVQARPSRISASFREE